MFTLCDANTADPITYAYQTLVTPDPVQGTPVYSILLLELQESVVVGSTVLYDVSPDPTRAARYCDGLIADRVPPNKAAEWLEPYLCEEALLT